MQYRKKAKENTGTNEINFRRKIKKTLEIQPIQCKLKLCCAGTDTNRLDRPRAGSCSYSDNSAGQADPAGRYCRNHSVSGKRTSQIDHRAGNKSFRRSRIIKYNRFFLIKLKGLILCFQEYLF